MLPGALRHYPVRIIQGRTRLLGGVTITPQQPGPAGQRQRLPVRPVWATMSDRASVTWLLAHAGCSTLALVGIARRQRRHPATTSPQGHRPELPRSTWGVAHLRGSPAGDCAAVLAFGCIIVVTQIASQSGLSTRRLADSGAVIMAWPLQQLPPIERLLGPHSPRQGSGTLSVVHQVHGCGEGSRHSVCVLCQQAAAGGLR